MQESFGARHTLICERLEERVQSGAEVFGGKGVQMELLHRRLGHTSQRGLERLVKEQMVRGLEDGIKGDLNMCRVCKMGKASEPPHPRKDPQYRAKEPLELVHTDITGPFRPRAIEG